MPQHGGVYFVTNFIMEGMTLKKLMNIAMITAAVAMLALTGCTPSKIAVEETGETPEDALVVSKGEQNASSFTLPETVAYTIPADAPTGEHGGPGAMETTAVDYSYYPEDKQPGNSTPEEEGTSVILYRIVDGGVDQDFDLVDVCDADSLINLMIKDGIIKDGCVVEEFSSADYEGKLRLNELKPVYYKATDEEIIACVVNTFLDNLMLDSIELTIGDQEYGKLEFSTAYDAT